MGPLDGVAGAVVTVLGCCTALVAVAGVLQFVWRQILRPAKPLKAYGKWAVVTGGTDGIGKEYALQLAKEGLNILVVSRNEDKLKAICDEVKEAAGVEAKYVAADLCSSEESVWSRIAAAIKDVEVGLLINNAGMSYPYPDYLDALEPGLVEKIIAINATATTKMCQLVLPQMRERNRGCIVNISSGVSQALPACPLLSAYAASKAYVDELSSSLAVEYAQYGIDVQVQAPAFVATKMSKIRRPSLSAPSPETWVRAGMRHIGHEVQATPYVAHGMLSLVCPLLPSGLVSSQWLGMMKGMRKRALKKAQEAAKEQ